MFLPYWIEKSQGIGARCYLHIHRVYLRPSSGRNCRLFSCMPQGTIYVFRTNSFSFMFTHFELDQRREISGERGPSFWYIDGVPYFFVILNTMAALW